MAVVLLFATAAFVGVGILVRPTHSYAWPFYFASLASLVGAAVAYSKLRRIESIESGPSVTRQPGEVSA